jgi:hypothetical protein
MPRRNRFGNKESVLLLLVLLSIVLVCMYKRYNKSSFGRKNSSFGRKNSSFENENVFTMNFPGNLQLNGEDVMVLNNDGMFPLCTSNADGSISGQSCTTITFTEDQIRKMKSPGSSEYINPQELSFINKLSSSSGTVEFTIVYHIETGCVILIALNQIMYKHVGSPKKAEQMKVKIKNTTREPIMVNYINTNFCWAHTYPVTIGPGKEINTTDCEGSYILVSETIQEISDFSRYCPPIALVTEIMVYFFTRLLSDMYANEPEFAGNMNKIMDGFGSSGDTAVLRDMLKKPVILPVSNLVPIPTWNIVPIISSSVLNITSMVDQNGNTVYMDSLAS